MKKLFKTIYYILLGCLAVIALLLIFSIFPITGNYKIMIVQSGSMEPEIKTGSIVIAKPVSEYKIGDIITFGKNTRTETPTTHRIHDIRVHEGNPIYITKGDANNAPDSKEILQSEIIGKVIFFVPYVGYAVSVAKKPLGFMLLIIIPAIVIIYDEFRKIWGEVKKIKSKKKDNEQDKKIKELEKEIDELSSKDKSDE
ncbi:signal peptidase I [Patescibacteria group bacterium]